MLKKTKKAKKIKKTKKSKKNSIVEITKTNVRPILKRLTKGQLLLVARSAVEELVSRSHLKCDPAIVIFSILAPENFGGE